jgi:iron complex outermembrane receptor protein
MSISVVNSKQLKNRYEPSILPTLTEEVPGLFITNRGIMGYSVSGGSAGGMSIRGIGGSPTAGLLVLIDGHPQYMGMMGHPLADTYSNTIAERVEVVRGPASILYGSNAMGGVINIITPKQTQDQVRTNARIMYGSYNTLTTEINNSVRKGKWNTHTALSYNRTDGHRDNMNFDQYSGYAKVGYTFSPHWNSFADINLVHVNAENPGATTNPITDGLAKVNRGMTSLALINQYEQTSGAFKFFYNFGEHKINDGYNTTNGTPKPFRFHSHDKMLGASLYQSYQLFEGNQTTTGIDYQNFGGWARNDSLNGNQKNLVDKNIQDLAGYINMKQQLGNTFTLNAGIRYDYNSHTGGEWIPQLGISYLPSNQTVLKAILSKGFRNPTIREMYMFPPQNPNLKPERLMNYELSAVHYLLNHHLRAELNLYYINGDNLIQVVKQPNGQMLNINTGEVENYGLEASIRYQLNPNLSLSSNYSYLHMKHAVVAAPEHKLYIGAQYNRAKWNIATGMQYIHNLYTQIKPTAITENYAMWNLRAAYRPTKIVELFLKGENLLNQSYSINAGFPMPGATCFGGVHLRF